MYIDINFKHLALQYISDLFLLLLRVRERNSWMLTGNLFRSIRNRCPVSQINRRLKLSDSLCSHLNNTHGKLRNLFTICILAIQRPHHFSSVICMESLKKSASLCGLFQLTTVIQKSVGLFIYFVVVAILETKRSEPSRNSTWHCQMLQKWLSHQGATGF